jgi:hypothetical protein
MGHIVLIHKNKLDLEAYWYANSHFFLGTRFFTVSKFPNEFFFWNKSHLSSIPTHACAWIDVGRGAGYRFPLSNHQIKPRGWGGGGGSRRSNVPFSATTYARDVGNLFCEWE